jgi:hypothetical protein
MPALTAVRQREVGLEKQLIKSFVHGHLSYQ